MRISPTAIAALPILVISLLGPRGANAAEVITTNGDRLSGTLLHADAETVVLQTAYAGRIRIDRAQVSVLRQQSAQATTTTRAHSAEPPEASRQTSSAVVPPKFSGRVNFALSDDSGNTDTTEIDFDYQLDYRRGWHRLRSLGVLEFDTNDGEQTADKWSTLNHYSRLFPSRWYGAAWFALQHDRFADLRLRTMGGPALGYLASEDKAFHLSIELGPTLLRDDFRDQPDQDFTGASWLLNYDQLVWNDRLQPYHRQFGYVALDGQDKRLWQSWTGVRLPLANGLSASVEFEFDYDSHPAVEVDPMSRTVFPRI
ncbi:Putative salt-induced outer membrane protein [Thiorhodovibrio winogradskyi]|uniref:Salt-induced outer membrane protein n=1 Tax=Thiorhodovibrio winogradskyi TaxID=77007 RepID=A0ABZ0SBG8_9GAMM|nr:DUF481 domain-containing protein [Thiorhodovibrio winogradskyi]